MQIKDVRGQLLDPFEQIGRRLVRVDPAAGAAGRELYPGSGADLLFVIKALPDATFQLRPLYSTRAEKIIDRVYFHLFSYVITNWAGSSFARC